MSNQQRTHTRIPDEPPEDQREWSMFHYRTALERAEKVIADRGVCERDCSPPLDQRIDNLIVDFRTSEHNLAAICVKQEQRIAELEAAVKSVEDLIDESHGVSGLHRNGDVAPWSELLMGGRYEGWLYPLSLAMSNQREDKETGT